MTAVIEVTGLTKRYEGQAVVDDISFHVDMGEIFGILGPNGAGKTTAVECMEGLRRRDGGEVRILGLDPLTSRHRLHQRIGVQLQETQLQEKLRVEFVSGSEVMEISLSGRDPEEIAGIVNAVKKAYMDEVVNVALTRRTEASASMPVATCRPDVGCSTRRTASGAAARPRTRCTAPAVTSSIPSRSTSPDLTLIRS